jgi:hypothetical protein
MLLNLVERYMYSVSLLVISYHMQSHTATIYMVPLLMLCASMWLGGRLSNTMTSYLSPNAERYDPSTNEWTSIAPPLSPRAVAATCVIDDSIAVLGGGMPRLDNFAPLTFICQSALHEC